VVFKQYFFIDLILNYVIENHFLLHHTFNDSPFVLNKYWYNIHGDIMGERTEFECDNCGWEYVCENDIFMIDKNHEINLSPILMMTFKEIEDNPVNGEYWEYYCYHCNSFVEKFIITENNNDFKKEKITKDIESFNDSIKIIKFEKTENDFLDTEVCPECGNNIEKLTHDSECPKCHNGKLYATFSIMMD